MNNDYTKRHADCLRQAQAAMDEARIAYSNAAVAVMDGRTDRCTHELQRRDMWLQSARTWIALAGTWRQLNRSVGK